jgi:hypothetical protein
MPRAGASLQHREGPPRRAGFARNLVRSFSRSCCGCAPMAGGRATHSHAPRGFIRSGRARSGQAQTGKLANKLGHGYATESAKAAFTMPIIPSVKSKARRFHSLESRSSLACWDEGIRRSNRTAMHRRRAYAPFSRPRTSDLRDSRKVVGEVAAIVFVAMPQRWYARMAPLHAAFLPCQTGSARSD